MCRKAFVSEFQAPGLTNARIQVGSARLGDLGGIEMVYVMRKEQTKFARSPQLSLVEQFSILAT